MEIRIEIDDARITREVIDTIVRELRYEVERQTIAAVQVAIRDGLATHARDILREVLATLTVPMPVKGGAPGETAPMTLREYVTRLLVRVDETRIHYDKRPRLVQIADDFVRDHAQAIFRDLAGPHVERLREEIKARLVGMVLP